MDKTAKEITINYLENIKQDYENAFFKIIESEWSDKNKLRSTTKMTKDIDSLNRIIYIVAGSEGE